jgi:tetratricopeptide (TPR) repeat protein
VVVKWLGHAIGLAQLGCCKVVGIVKNRMFMIVIVMSAVFCWPTSGSIENPGINNPIGPSTIPPSTYSNSLMNSPSPIDMDGNLLITGNVRRGRQFRGDVPYRSPTSFGSSLGTSTLSSFLRDTAGPEDFRTYSNKYGSQPYYSPTETVTTMMPGRSGIFMPESTRLSTRAQQDTRSEASSVFGLDSTANEQPLFSQGGIVADSDSQRPTSQYGPLAQSKLLLESRFPTSMTPSQKSAELLTPSRIGIHDQGRESSAELFREQVQDVEDRTRSTMTVPNPDRGENLWEKNEPLKFQNQETNIEGLRPRFEVQTSEQNQDKNRKQTTYLNQGKSALEQTAPSMNSTSQENLYLQKGTNWSGTNTEFQSGREQTSAVTLDRTKNAVSGLTGTGQDLNQIDVLERIRQQLEDLTKSLDAAMQSRNGYKDVSPNAVTAQDQKALGYQRQVTVQDVINPSGSSNYYRPRGAEPGFNGEQLVPSAEGGLGRTDVNLQAGSEFTGISKYNNSQKIKSPLDELKKLSQAEISTEASRIMGSRNSLESFSQSKFNQYMRDAETYLKAGRYYRAASCFSLASVYQPDNPLALAGRGHALFAAGEYVSSALFISRALTISPEYLRMRVDLGVIFGDENKLAGRIEDIKQWLARSGSSQLQFLLGYVYYRTGQLPQAKKVIDAAYEKTPESRAVQAMKITIDNMMMQQ